MSRRVNATEGDPCRCESSHLPYLISSLDACMHREPQKAHRFIEDAGEWQIASTEVRSFLSSSEPSRHIHLGRCLAFARRFCGASRTRAPRRAVSPSSCSVFLNDSPPALGVSSGLQSFVFFSRGGSRRNLPQGQETDLTVCIRSLGMSEPADRRNLNRTADAASVCVARRPSRRAKRSCNCSSERRCRLGVAKPEKPTAVRTSFDTCLEIRH